MGYSIYSWLTVQGTFKSKLKQTHTNNCNFLLLKQFIAFPKISLNFHFKNFEKSLTYEYKKDIIRIFDHQFYYFVN